MTARHWYRDDTNELVEITQYVRIVDNWAAKGKAEEGAKDTIRVAIKDPALALDFVAHRRYVIREDEIVAGDDVVFSGFTGDQRISRGVGTEDYTPHGRVWFVDLVDDNTVWSRRAMRGADCNRPAETDVERMQWLLATAEAAQFDDVTTYVSTADPVDMEANDYTGQMFNQIADDCAQKSGKNWFAWTGAALELFAWYGAGSLTTHSSALSLSNDPADMVDSELLDGTSLVWPIRDNTELLRKGDRVASGVVIPWDGGETYKRKASTATRFAERDAIMPSANVRTAAEANARAAEYLLRLATQEHRISTGTTVPAVLVNEFKQGLRIPFKATHLPDYEDFVWCRILERTARPAGAGELYELDLELAGEEPDPDAGEAGDVYGVLWMAHGPIDGTTTYWEQPGDTPPPGHPGRPTVGLITALSDGTPPHERWTYYGWEVNGDGTIDVTFYATATGVLDGTYDVTWSILKNGAAVATVTHTVSLSPGETLEAWADEATVTVDNLVVADGDVITSSVVCDPPTMPFFRTPVGTGNMDERLEITDGSLS